MKIENIQRSDGTSYECITADEGMKLINKDYLDKNTEDLNICSVAYLCAATSSSAWSEITEEEAAEHQKNYEEWRLNKENNEIKTK